MLIASLLLAATFTRPMEKVSTMDPIHASGVYDSRALQLVYETPLDIDYYARPYRLRPGFCELPDVSTDGRTYTFRVRKGATLGARDLVRGIERVRDPANASPGAWTMAAVESVRATDERTVVIRLKKRLHVFPWLMSLVYVAVRGENGEGSGPYRLENWWKNHEMTFVKNESWHGWGELAARGEPGEPFDRIRYLVVDDVSTQWLMFLKGEVDLLGEISRDSWDAVVDGRGALDARLAATGVKLHGIPKQEVAYLGINMSDPVLGPNRKLRQALNCAFDFPTWCAFYNNRVDPCNGPVPLGVEGRLETPFAYAPNLSKAKRLLAEAGYPDGLDPRTGRRLALTLAIGRPTQESREAGELTAAFYARIGIRLELSYMTWTSFLRAINEGRVQLFRLAWVGDYPDAENFLQLFHSANVSPGANHSNYRNPEFDAAYDAAMASETAEMRNRHWTRCQEIVREDCPWIFCHYQKLHSLTRPTVGNYIPSNFPYGSERYLRRPAK